MWYVPRGSGRTYPETVSIYWHLGQVQGLSVNSMETEIIVFTENFEWEKTCNLKIGGQEWSHKSSTKYLGVITYRKLCWKKKLNDVTNKKKASLQHTKRAVNTLATA